MPKKAAKAKPKAKAVKAPKAEPKAPRAKKEPNPLEPFVGALVRYYDEGWRHGYLDSTEGEHAVRVRPIGGIYASTVVRTHKYLNTDVTVVEVKNGPVAK